VLSRRWWAAAGPGPEAGFPFGGFGTARHPAHPARFARALAGTAAHHPAARFCERLPAPSFSRFSLKSAIMASRACLGTSA